MQINWKNLYLNQFTENRENPTFHYKGISVVMVLNIRNKRNSLNNTFKKKTFGAYQDIKKLLNFMIIDNTFTRIQ